jgi:hypothetical protein
MRALIAVALSVLCLAVTCETPLTPTDPTAADAGPAPEPEDAGDDGALPPETGATACARACQRMARLGCPGHEGSPGGASCAEVCENHESSQVGSFCPSHLERMQGKPASDGERTCDEDELQRAFEACL